MTPADAFGARPRIRRSPFPDRALLVVRGHQANDHDLRTDAIRFHRRYPDWQRFGVSAFLAGDEAEVDVLCETKLERWPFVAVFDRADLVVKGIEVVPTFRTPHVTLAHRDLDELLGGLVGCEQRVIVNPYHEPDPGPLEQR